MSFIASTKRFIRLATGRTRAFNLTRITEEAFPGRTRVPNSVWSKTIHGLRMRRQDPNIAVDFASPGCAVSSVPYFAGATELLIHNFLSHNYGLRDPVLIQVMLVQGERGVAMRQLLLEPNQVVHVEDIDDFLEYSGSGSGTLVVSAHHPRISIIAGQFRFVALYRSPAGYSGCHSMPAMFTELPIGCAYRRAIAPHTAIAASRVINTSLRGDLGALSQTAVVSGGSSGDDFSRFQLERPTYSAVGYFGVMDQGAPTCLWHDGPSDHLIAERVPAAPGTAQCAAPLFGFNRYNATAIIDAHQVGFPVTKVRVTLTNEAGEAFAEATLDDLATPCSVVDLAKLFAGDRHRVNHGHAIFDFLFDHRSTVPGAELMLSLFYSDGERVLDQIHTTRSRSWRFEAAPQASRCRKFGPLIVNENTRTLISLQNLAPAGGAPPTDFRLRIFTTNDEEIVLTQHVSKDRCVIVDVGRLLPGLDNVRGVIWIEHPDVNVGAHWCILDAKRDAFAADHFTGG